MNKTLLYTVLCICLLTSVTALEQITDSLTVGSVVNTANGVNSMTGGIFSQANGNNAFSFGKRAIANNAESISMGINTRAEGIQSVAIGGWSSAFGLRSISIGDGNIARGDASFTTNYGNIAYGFASSAFGEQTRAQASHSFVIGRFNLQNTGDIDSLSENDHIFVIGNGQNEQRRHNAVTVLRNGNVGINVPDPISPLAVVKLPNSPPDRSGVLGRLCITVDGNVFVDANGEWC